MDVARVAELTLVEDISHEGLRVLLRAEGVSFQRLKTFKESNDPDIAAKQARVLELYAIADGHAEPGPDDPTLVICSDEFGPLNLQPHPGRHWAWRLTAPVSGGAGDARTASARTASGICWPPAVIRVFLAGARWLCYLRVTPGPPGKLDA